MNKKIIKVKAKDQKTLELDERIVQFSNVLKNADFNEEIDLTMADSPSLIFVYSLYKSNDFQSFHYKTEVNSNNLEDVLPQNIYEQFKPYLNQEKIIDLDKIKPIVDCCDFYDFKEIKDFCLMAIGSAFYFNEKNLEEFNARWNPDQINYKKMTSNERINLIIDYENIFLQLLDIINQK